MNKAIFLLISFICGFLSFAHADELDPAYVIKKQRSFNTVSSAWATCRITECEVGFSPTPEGMRCIAQQSSDDKTGGQILESVTDSSTNYKIFYTLGSINQGSLDANTNYRAASNLDIPTTTVTDSNSNYQIIIGVQK